MPAAHETGMLTAQQMGYHENSSWDGSISNWDTSSKTN
jgi:hypothetical protein